MKIFQKLVTASAALVESIAPNAANAAASRTRALSRLGPPRHQFGTNLAA